MWGEEFACKFDGAASGVFDRIPMGFTDFSTSAMEDGITSTATGGGVGASSFIDPTGKGSSLSISIPVVLSAISHTLRNPATLLQVSFSVDVDETPSNAPFIREESPRATHKQTQTD